MSLDFNYKKNPKIVWQELHGNYVLLDPANSKTHELNEMAFFIWDHFSIKINMNDITQNILKEFDVKLELAQKEVIEMTEEFIAKKLLIKDNEAN